MDNLANVSLRQAPVASIAWLAIGLLFSPALSPRAAGAPASRLRLPRVPPALPIVVWAAGMVWYGNGVAARVKAEGLEIRGVLAAVRNEQGKEAGYYAAAAEADPTYLEALFNAAASVVFGGKPDVALAYTGRLARLAPNYPKLALVEAAAYYQLDSLDAALRSVGTELGRRTHPEAWYIAAKIHEARGDSPAEHAALEELLRQGTRGATPVYARHACRRLCLLCGTPREPGHALDLARKLAARLPGNRDAGSALALIDSCAGAAGRPASALR